jgi:sec-independent protein translocase protein TatB
MFGIDSPELLVIAVVALVVIGPKELPALLRTWGKWMAQMRGMASEFRGHVDEMVRQSELDDVKKQLEAAHGGLDLKALDPTRQIKSAIQEGMTEGEKAIAEAKSAFDVSATESALPDPVLPESVSAEAAPAELPAPESPPVALPIETSAATPSTGGSAAAEIKPIEDKPAKAAAE